ncbi:MAG: hypothetical protein EDM79_20425 [Chloroflexi bacterium]|nr:MAG: hypothetical protein EDM79_20425 [Chloroflexota bacterium]
MATDVVGFDWGWWVDDIQFYSCVPVVPSIQAQSFRSQSTYDGWVLESGETTNNGGTLNRTDRIIVGDDAMNRQYRSIISFDTSSLPDNAVIISVTLRLKSLSGFVGQNPFNFLGALTADVRRVKFGSGPGLQLTDFRSASHLDAVGSFNPTIVSGWRDAIVTSASPYINRLGTTQFRLRFTLDDNNDLGADYVRFYAGETYSKAPRLIVQYYIP